MPSRYHHVVVFTSLCVLLLLTVWLTPQIGAFDYSPEAEELVIRRIRLPRLVLGMMAGAGLSLAGMTFQAIFRNPLATPFTLGVSSGASLAIALGIACGWPLSLWGGAGQVLLAFAGALAVVALVYGIARFRSEAPTATLLLAGVSINFICGAGIILIQYFRREQDISRLIHWLIGNIEAIGESQQRLMWIIGPLILLGAALLFRIHRELDLLMMGEQLAAARGVHVAWTRKMAYFCASIVTAAVVSACGPIAFVGLLVPHSMRLLVGPSHRVLLPACLLFGVILVPVCDCIARNLLSWTTQNNYAELPVGVVTNVLGGIFFLIILLRRKDDRPIMA